MFRLEPYSLDSPLLPPLWKIDDGTFPRIQERSLQWRYFTIRISNVGSGAAKDIRLNWVYDEAKLIQTIAELSGPVVAYLTDRRNVLRVDKNGGVCREFNLAKELSVTCDYLLPAASDPAGLLVSLPESFTTLVSLRSYLRLARDKGASIACLVYDGDEDEFGKITLTLRYRDIAGFEYARAFIGRVQTRMVSWSGKHMAVRLQGSVEFNLSDR
jgi:hypothetical protein